MHRRHLLLAFPVWLTAGAQNLDLPLASPVDAVNIYIILTDRDINSKSQNFRFQYSSHSPMANTSVLSIARLRYTNVGTPAANNVVGERVAKMLLRIIGEMRLGWKRTSDPVDLMYAPIMSIEDVDRMSLSHTVQSRKQQP